MSVEAFLRDNLSHPSMTKSAAEAPVGSVPGSESGGTGQPAVTPPQPSFSSQPTPSVAGGLDLAVPWRGALLGGLGYGVYDYLFGDEDEGEEKGLGRFLRKGLTGAATGAGVEVGTRVGGELARRHAIATAADAAKPAGNNVLVGATPVAGALGLGGLGYYLAKERKRKERRR